MTGGRGRPPLVTLAALAALVGVGGLGACTDDADSTLGRADSASAPAGTLRVGIERPHSFDPAEASPADQGELVVADLLYDGLALTDASGRAVPVLAERWEATPDQRSWRFVMAAGARFADGQPVTAADVKYSLERVAAKGAASLTGVRLDVVSGYRAFVDGTAAELVGIRVVDDRTVEVALDAPLAVLPELLSSPSFGIVAGRAAGGDAEAGPLAFADAPMGTGPFRFVSESRDVVRLERMSSDATSVEAVELHLYDDHDAAYADFVAGRLDLSLVPAARVDDAAQRFGTEAFAPFGAEVFYAFNLASPKFADVRFRQAIVKAIDRQSLVGAVYDGIGDPLTGLVPAGLPGHVVDPCGEACAFDPAGARALVAAVFPAGNVPEVQLDYYQDPGEEAVATIIETSLEAVGIPAARRPRPFQEYQQFAVSGEQELFRLGWIGAYPSPEAYVGPLFSTGSPDNATGFADQAVQGLLDSARAEPAPDARATQYQEVERAILAQTPIVPIVQFRTRAVVGERVEGLRFGVTGTFDVRQVTVGGE
ncbi:MAG: ABC transporter substrate-binding protein [Acidimicrobiales bacterium]